MTFRGRREKRLNFMYRVNVVTAAVRREGLE